MEADPNLVFASVIVLVLTGIFSVLLVAVSLKALHSIEREMRSVTGRRRG